MTRGFSTLEILIALAVLVSSFTAVVLLTSAESLSTDAQISSDALGAARKAIETEQALARQDFKLVVSTTTPAGIAGVSATTTISVDQYDPVTRVFTPFSKIVTATVSWKGTYGRTQKITLSGLVANFNNATGGDTCSTVLTDANGNHGNWKSPSVTNLTFATAVGDSNAANPYPLTGVEAYQKRLYVTAATSSAAFGVNNPASGVDNNAVGTIAWSNFSRVTAKDGNTASLNTNGTAVSHYLKATNFGFTIPPGSTIVGIKVDIYKNASGNTATNGVIDSQVKLVKANGAVGSKNNADTVTRWTSGAIADSSYGYNGTVGSSDPLWSESDWTPANINSANFGVVLAVTGSQSGANRTANVDSIQVTVYYTKEFYIFNISNPASPTFLGGLATSTFVSGMNAIAVATSSVGNYAYVATNSTTGSNQIQIIDVTNPASPFVVSTDAAGMIAQGIANGIFYKDGYAYLTLSHVGSGPEFNIIDVSNPISPQWKGGYSLGTTTNSVYVNNGYAYVTTNDSTKELIILNVTDPSNPTLVSSYNATPDSTNFGYGRGLYAVGNSVFFGRSWTNSSTIPQFLVLDASSTPPSLVTSKSLGTNFSLRDIIVRDYLGFLLTGSTSSGGQLQIVSATSTAQWASPVTLPATTGQGGVGIDCEGNYLFAASVDGANKGYISVVTGN